jgi:hypothetical protein
MNIDKYSFVNGTIKIRKQLPVEALGVLSWKLQISGKREGKQLKME